MARWVQYAPGTRGAATAVHWGDAPASLVNTILVRAVVTDAMACPAANLDHGVSLPMTQRFIGGDGSATSLTSTPGSPHALNSQPGYPQYFVQPAQDGGFSGAMAHATPRWGECEAVVPPGHRMVTVDGVDLKLPVVNPKRILVMGDTGCRVHAGGFSESGAFQDCQSPGEFPFAYLSAFEASLRPDVIIHVGDYSHRDATCATQGLEARPSCSGQGSGSDAIRGDTFDAWNADLFVPAQSLLQAAPWIMLRGNDESCGRGARGWFALLDPFPYSYANVVCGVTPIYPAPNGATATYTADFEPSYVVPLNGVNFMVHDSSLAEDGLPNLDLAENYDVDLSNLLAALRQAAPDAPAVLLTHKPAFDRSHGTQVDVCDPGHGTAGDESAADNSQAVFGGNLTLQTVFSGAAGHMGTEFYDGIPANIAFLLSGHVHQFRYVNVGTGDGVNQQFAPQLIVGTGGSLAGADCSARHDTIAGVFGDDAFGFAVLDATDTGYTAQIYKQSATLAGTCKIRLNPRTITCHF